MEFQDMLKRMVKEEASDLFIKVGSPPTLRIDGRIRFLQAEAITDEDARDIMDHIQRTTLERLETEGEIDTSYDIPGVGRFRVNIFKQRGTITYVFRHIGSINLSFDELYLPKEPLTKLANSQRGLVLVTGVAGSGKSTTLAAILNYINENYNKHIVTVEDPIEYMFRDKRSIFSQREVGVDTRDFSQALKHVVRQSPDVIMIGEMRDQETMEAALMAAETGHLVLSTLHTLNSTQTVERIINYFPPHQHELVRLQLSLVLEGVISQRLVLRKSGDGRVPAIEIMMKSPTVKDLIREGKTTSLYKAIQESDYFGSQTFNQSLKELYEAQLITLEKAMEASDAKEELKLEIRGIVKGTRADFDFQF